MAIMNQIAVNASEGATHLHDIGPPVRDHSCENFRRVDRAAHISALGIFLRNFPLGVFDDEERRWFLDIQSRVCHMESNAFDDLGME